MPYEWLNCDFMKTNSYSPKLIEVSKYYRTFSNVLSIRTISSEYLIAMKLMSARKYKSDLSDIVGILKEHKEIGNIISFDQIQNAVFELYGNWDKINQEAYEFIRKITNETINYDEYFKEIKNEETNNHLTLLEFDQNYPKVLKNDNLEEILEIIKRKKEMKNN